MGHGDRRERRDRVKDCERSQQQIGSRNPEVMAVSSFYGCFLMGFGDDTV